MTAASLPDPRGSQPNVDRRVVEAFGEEWETFDQSAVAQAELRRTFDEYFAVFPWTALSPSAVGFDLGCGSGRWAKCVAPRVGRLHCIDASAAALAVAKRNLEGVLNCEFHLASVDQIPLLDGSADFGYSLGVLHHVPNTAEGIRACVRKLAVGAPFLLYLYYRFDNRPRWYAALWRASDLARRAICRLPYPMRLAVTGLIATSVYWPLARIARVGELLGLRASRLPLYYYSRRSYYTMRTDALDRFGTRLEQRFSKPEIERMMRAAGLRDITFSDQPPFWCAVGFRA
jgi:SAM-dependent methyltransferase